MKARIITMLAMLVLAVAAVGLATTTTHAAPVEPEQVLALIQTIEDAEDPDAAYWALTPEQRAAIRKALSVQSVEIVTEVTSPDGWAFGMSNGGCSIHYKHAIGKGFWGTTLWKFTSRTYWCYDGTFITNVPHFTASGHVYGDHWTYHGTLFKTTTGGQNWSYHHDSTQGEFRYCEPPNPLDAIPMENCTDYQYPELHKIQYGDGTTG